MSLCRFCDFQVCAEEEGGEGVEGGSVVARGGGVREGLIWLYNLS